MSVSTSDDDQLPLDEVIQRLSLSRVDDEQEDDNSDAQIISKSQDSSTAAVRSVSESSRDTTSCDDAQVRRKQCSQDLTTSRKSLDPLNAIKRFLPGGAKLQSKSSSEQLDRLSVDRLPQRFVVKYLGHRPCPSLWGIANTRPLVDEMVVELKGMVAGADLPLIEIVISAAGIQASLHRRNVSRRTVPDTGLTPLEFISYAVQDTRYSRVAAFILVREMSSRSRSAECHAYLCDSPQTARRISLSMSLAFRTYAKQLDGKPFKFQVDLRQTAELKAEFTASSKDGSGKKSADCEA